VFRKPFALSLALVELALAACAGRSSGGGVEPMNLMNLRITAALPKDTIGEEEGFEGLGTINSSKWQALLSGFTQEQYSQSLGFPPGTKITVTNISTNLIHTLDVVKKIPGPPANFPPNANLPINPHGDGKLGTGYASGQIFPGKSVTVTLVKGIYLIGCAFHYIYGMRDVIVVRKHAKPGPQATPPA
jgi:plastocyanin